MSIQKRLPIFAERFKELREGKSQEQFAEFLGISRPTVGFYENGDRLPDAATLANIAISCEVSSDWLLGINTDTEFLKQYIEKTKGSILNACDIMISNL